MDPHRVRAGSRQPIRTRAPGLRTCSRKGGPPAPMETSAALGGAVPAPAAEPRLPPPAAATPEQAVPASGSKVDLTSQSELSGEVPAAMMQGLQLRRQPSSRAVQAVAKGGTNRTRTLLPVVRPGPPRGRVSWTRHYTIPVVLVPTRPAKFAGSRPCRSA